MPKEVGRSPGIGDHRDAKDRELRSDLLELLERGVAIDWDVGAGSWCHGQVATKDRGASACRHLLEMHGLAPTMSQCRLAARGP
jgi:hypothetical protein